MSSKWSTLGEETAAFDAEVESIESWWKTERQQHIKRPYSAKSIAALRNIGFKIDYPSSNQGRKLWKILNDHRKSSTYELTFGTTEPMIAKEMAKHMQTIYVSGALCGISQAAWPGADHADYPADLVPSVVKRIFNTQLWHDQRQTQMRMRHNEKDRYSLESIDYLLPIIADGDMGFGTLTGCMKMCRSFVEAGVAMIHIDDLALGLKKFTNGEGRTIVPTSEYLARLRTARMTFDIMGADTMLLCRCDSDHAEFITSVVDSRDHPYVLGATKEVELFVDAIEKARSEGQDYSTVKASWKAAAGLKTIDEAIRGATSDTEYADYAKRIEGQHLPITKRLAIVKDISGKTIAFDIEAPRLPSGQYMWKWSTQAVIDRSILAASLGDVTWSRQDKPNKADMQAFHSGVRAVFPDRLFAFGYTGAYDFVKTGGYTEAEVETFPSDIAKMGVVWQVQPIWATQGLSLHANHFAQAFKRDGIAGYMRDVAKPAIAGMATDKFGRPQARGDYLADSFFDVVAGDEITGVVA